MAGVRIVAVSDVHSPRMLMDYLAALSRHRGDCAEALLVIWAGDMVDKGRVHALRPVVAATRRMCPRARIVAVYGNEEYMDREHLFARSYPEVLWLNDTYTVIETPGRRIAIYGTRGAIDEPTEWQRRHIPAIRVIYKRRVEKLRETVSRLRRDGYDVIVVSHYAPTYATLEGEDPRIWKYLGSKEMEKALLETKPLLAIHGHAHHSRRLEAEIDGVKVLNVALPARGDITVIEL